MSIVYDMEEFNPNDLAEIAVHCTDDAEARRAAEAISNWLGALADQLAEHGRDHLNDEIFGISVDRPQGLW